MYLLTFSVLDIPREEQKYITGPALLQADKRDESPQIQFKVTAFSSAAVEIKFSGLKAVRDYFLLWDGEKDGII